ncbi:MAG: sulfotransferase, partial [Thermoguttaceae bacterium]|nr:sulfotransferase [Thermoguttaceae bacterium]
WFLKALTVAHPTRILLTSPPHTARSKAILERFPDAKFVYLHRDPYTLFPSTYNLWMKLSRTHGVQIPRGENLQEKVFCDFERMDAAYQEDIHLLRDDQLIDISFDQLTGAPIETLQKIYEKLRLGDFDLYRQKFVDFAATQKNYKKNKFEIDPEIRSEITRRWHGYIERYGYEEPKE